MAKIPERYVKQAEYSVSIRPIAKRAYAYLMWQVTLPDTEQGIYAHWSLRRDIWFSAHCWTVDFDMDADDVKSFWLFINSNGKEL